MGGTLLDLRIGSNAAWEKVMLTAKDVLRFMAH